MSLKSELNNACKIDPGLRTVIDTIGYPKPRSRATGYSTLAEIINAQQLSTRAAAAIWKKLEKSCGGAVTYRKILNRDPETLRECGLSRQKIEYLQGLAEMVRNGNLQLETLDSLSDNGVIDELTNIRGMGRWSAEIYAMFALDRRDFFPAKDIALQVAVQRYYQLPERPGEELTRELSEKWSPHRTAVAVLMWRYYGATTLD